MDSYDVARSMQANGAESLLGMQGRKKGMALHARRLLVVVLTTALAALSFVVASPTRAQAGQAVSQRAVISLGLREELRGYAHTPNGRLAHAAIARTVRVVVTATRDVRSQIASLGGSIIADAAGKVIAASLPASGVETLANTSGVTGLFPAERAVPEQQRDIVAIRAPQAWALKDSTGLPVQGSHVLIGFVDSGIDLHNPDFRN